MAHTELNLTLDEIKKRYKAVEEEHHLLAQNLVFKLATYIVKNQIGSGVFPIYGDAFHSALIADDNLIRIYYMECDEVVELSKMSIDQLICLFEDIRNNSAKARSELI